MPVSERGKTKKKMWRKRGRHVDLCCTDAFCYGLRPTVMELRSFMCMQGKGVCYVSQRNDDAFMHRTCMLSIIGYKDM
jgi:hypothetical protein